MQRNQIHLRLKPRKDHHKALRLSRSVHQRHPEALPTDVQARGAQGGQEGRRLMYRLCDREGEQALGGKSGEGEETGVACLMVADEGVRATCGLGLGDAGGRYCGSVGVTSCRMKTMVWLVPWLLRGASHIVVHTLINVHTVHAVNSTKFPASNELSVHLLVSTHDTRR